jgi:hypothetical protein
MVLPCFSSEVRLRSLLPDHQRVGSRPPAFKM